MIDPISFSGALLLMQKSLDSVAIRHQNIANNLANVDTPGFKRVEVSFQEQLKAAIDKNAEPCLLWRTHPNHLPLNEPMDLRDFKPMIKTVTETIGRNDGNNVDLEMETAKLAENQLMYQSLSDVTARHLSSLKTAISEGKR
jgi:flagellar basal-body rod protein FlgB